MSVLVVYDTMVFLQAASRPDRVHATLRAVHDHRVKLCVSPELLAEIEDVLNRAEHKTRFPALSSEGVTTFVADIVAHATIFDPVPNDFTWPQHPDDDHVFNLAIHAKANYLVTRETRILKFATDTTAPANALRNLAPELAIITPKQFAGLLNAGALRSPK